MNRAEAAILLPPYRHNTDVVAGIGIGTNGQLMREIIKAFPKALQQTRKIAQRFNKGSEVASAKAVWDFLRNEIKYKEDSGLIQKVKQPSALIGSGTGDCKSYALFAAAVMANLGYPVALRFAGYNGATHPGHVYTIAGSTIIDGVFNRFNDEKKPMSFKKDFKMQIEHITGTGCNCTGSGCACQIGKIELAKAVRQAGKAVKATKAKAVEAVKKAAPAVVKKTAQLVKKATVMAPRTAFLQLVKLNVHSFAIRLDKKRAKALEIWRKIGGNPGELNASINAGLNRKPILGLYPTEVNNGIGIDPATISVATVLATAAPVIAIMASLIGGKDSDSGKQTETNTGGNTAVQDATSIIDNARTIIEKFKPAQEAPQGPAPTSTTSGGEGYQTTNQSAAEEAQQVESAGGNKWLLPVGILAALLLFR
jgi:hypothetical protein